MLAPDFIINIAGMPVAKRGVSAWRSHAQMLYNAIPDVRMTIEDVFGADDRIAVRLRVSGTHQGEFLGIRPTGKQINYQSSEIYRFRDGLIAEEWICSDTLTLLTQIGGVSSTRLAAMYLSGHRFWLGAAAGLSAGPALRGVWSSISTHGRRDHRHRPLTD
jgi:predicted ester cyclase